MSLTAPTPVHGDTTDRSTEIAVPSDADQLPARFPRVSRTAFKLHATADTEHHLTFDLCGELDLGVGRDVRNVFERELARGRNLTLNLSGLTFLDSAGLTALLDTIDSARAAGRRVTLNGPLAPQVQRVLQLTDSTHLISPPAI